MAPVAWCQGSMEDKAASIPWRPGDLKIAANGDQAARLTKVTRNPRDCDHQSPFCHLVSRFHGRQGRLHTLKTRKLGNRGNWRSSRSIDQGAKGPKRPRSPTWLLSLGAKDSWEIRQFAHTMKLEANAKLVTYSHGTIRPRSMRYQLRP